MADTKGEFTLKNVPAGADIPLVVGYLISSLVIIPITFMGVTAINWLQWLTQPIWIGMMVLPFAFILLEQPDVLQQWVAFQGEGGRGGFDYLAFGAATGVLCSLAIQIGEQVDYLRFLPPRTRANRFRWWAALIAAGPGWIVPGAMKCWAARFSPSSPSSTRSIRSRPSSPRRCIWSRITTCSIRLKARLLR